jgi:hypothetical protein
MSTEVLSGSEADQEAAVHREIRERAFDFARLNVHQDAVTALQAVLRDRLHDAGFLQLPETQYQAKLLAGDSQYAARASSKLFLRDCKIGFTANVMLTIGAGRLNYGEVAVVVSMRDELIGKSQPELAGKPGILAGKSFREVVKLAPSGNFASAQAWNQWVDMGLKLLTPAFLKTTFDQAVAHLEKVSTP